MKLIEKGNPKETKVTCARCKSIYSYTKEDVTVLYVGAECINEGVTCPVCGEAKATCVTILQGD